MALNRPLEFGSTESLFSAPAIRGVAGALQRDQKVLCVFFDQFEELLYKAELGEVFTAMRRVCAAVEEAQANVVIGFSWKTDGVIPTEHNAYHMWHALSDHRLEIGLTPFSEREVSLAINRFAKELGQPMIHQLRRVLQDHCQGFPWLLKKLCVHILELSRRGIDQMDILNQSINIQALFEKDLENLAPAELACIRQIASESPAEFFKFTQNFGDSVVSRLVDKRLVIRSGTRLTIYWDIFRDYILTDKIPYIPVTYIPQCNFPRYANALAFMIGKDALTYNELAQHMQRGRGATDNLVRDLVNIGHAEADRRATRIVPRFKTEKEALQIAFEFWRAHSLVRELFTSKLADGEFTEEEFAEVYRGAYKRISLGQNTVRIYVGRVLAWLGGLGFVVPHGRKMSLNDIQESKIDSLAEVVPGRIRKTNFFLGEAPPRKVVQAFEALCGGVRSRKELADSYGRNTCYALVNLGLMRRDGTPIGVVPVAKAERAVAERAAEAGTVRAANDLLASQTDASSTQVGRYVADRFEVQWSKPSQQRNGSALRQWAMWSTGLLKT